MSIDKLGSSIPASSAQNLEALDAGKQSPSTKGGNASADKVASKSFASKTVSLVSKGIKTGLSIAIKGTLLIAKFTANAALKVGKALAKAIAHASENKKTTTHLEVKPKALEARKATSIKDVKEAQKNLGDAIRNGKETIAKQKAAQKDRREIAALERRAKALKQESPVVSKKPNQDYTNFEKSGSTLSANANLSAKDKKDIAELEQRLKDLKKP
jgi:hypothetical protein